MSKKTRAIAFGVFVGVFLISYTIGTVYKMSDTESQGFLKDFQAATEGIDAFGIFLHNASVALPMFVPAFGVGWGSYTGWQTGAAFNAVISSNPDLAGLPPLALLLASPFGILELGAYSIGMSRSFLLITRSNSLDQRMKFDKTSKPDMAPLLQAVINELTRGIEMIAAVDDPTYIKSANGTGSVGGHFRHNLDFVVSFLNGIDSGRIDYNLRERDVRVEGNRQIAVERFRLAIKRLTDLSADSLLKIIFVRLEIEASCWHESSVGREMEFLHSHTVHHHALIGEKLAGFGVAATENFGVAPSTLEYWKKRAA